MADGRKAPDRREISIRWLSGTFLTGVTSSALMGIALFAALDGREQLAIPGEAYAATDIDEPVQGAEKGSRLIGTTIAAKPSDRVHCRNLDDDPGGRPQRHPQTGPSPT